MTKIEGQTHLVAEFKKTAWAAQIIPSSSVVAGWSCRRGT